MCKCMGMCITHIRVCVCNVPSACVCMLKSNINIMCSVGRQEGETKNKDNAILLRNFAAATSLQMI